MLPGFYAASDGVGPCSMKKCPIAITRSPANRSGETNGEHYVKDIGLSLLVQS